MVNYPKNVTYEHPKTTWRQKEPTPLSDEMLNSVECWWRAANYLSVGQIYLLDNPLLHEPLTANHIKPRLLGHWGTTPGLNFIYAHLNRTIIERDMSMLYITGPGHGGPGMVANAWLDSTYPEVYPDIDYSEQGMRKLFRQFSFPGGIPSHVAPETPGSIHEGGELGYSLSHAYGAAFDNPDLLIAAIVGDGEAETGPLATSWHGNKFLNPLKDGVVLPILHLNGYKIANPTILARIGDEELEQLMRGYGHTPYMFEGGFDGEDHLEVHKRFAALLDEVLNHITRIKADAEAGKLNERPRWPMIIFKTPKGWTCPPVIDDKQVEASWRSHQVPLANARDSDTHTKVLENWLKSYKPQELFDQTGAPVEAIRRLAPRGNKRMSDVPQANGGLLRRDLILPPVENHEVHFSARGNRFVESTRVLGEWLADVIRLNPDNFRIFGPDETASNRLAPPVYSATDKQFNGEIWPIDENIATTGRVIEMLSEHQCQGWLEGYLLTGRHGLFSSYEAFIHIVDAMVNQHAKWLKVSRHIPWRKPIASLNYLLTSHVWRQDHNGFSHQDPGFIDHVVNKKAEVVRVYLPADANTLLYTWRHCLKSQDYINVVVAGKQPAPQFLNMEEARNHFKRGLGIWEWASNEIAGEAPDVVIAAAGDVPTLEGLAAARILRERLVDLKVRFVNVIDLMRLQHEREHPHGISDAEFDAIFTTDKPVIFAWHGYPSLIHRLTYRRHVHDNIHVRGFNEEGGTTTPFDMVMVNDLDRYRLVMDVLQHVPGLAIRHAGLLQEMQDARNRASLYARTHGEDIPEVANWVWDDSPTQKTGLKAVSATGGDNEY
ncbi:phosphoketolase [Mangrovibacter phragmitis]|uniref:Probable phosphoketolase n=2 Tax=Mangrovibacter phragmitis TaxID=1691903 RepID=A0A1B7LAA0_9ENTR|nr:phosphoketolase [Mangrovibacter phragmitis]